MKVVIQKDLFERSFEVFSNARKEYGFEFFVTDILDEKNMLELHTKGVNCFVIGAEAYSNKFYEQLNEGTMIIRYGVGYNAVPIELCRKRGVKVAYTPGTLTDSVAEHTIALLMSVARNIPTLNQSMLDGNWTGIRGRELKNKTLAILGYGNIGKAVARIAGNGLGMKIFAYDYKQIEKAENLELTTTDFRLAVENADFISIHMATTPETIGFINAERIKLMKDGVVLINTARGELICESDLYEALTNGKISFAGLDVFAKEPYTPSEYDFRKLSNVVLTPHCGSNTFEASSNMAKIVVENILAYYSNGQLTLIPELH
jgi:D-3-phosphoglycerate dehydrogenase